jgi:iron-sulfur cluster assembly protein
MITVTSNASKKILSLMEKHPDADGLRISVRGGGCSGLQYDFAMDALHDRDKIVEHEGVKVLVDPKSAIYVKGSEFDYAKSLMEEGFTVKNPNAKGSCGCGTSFRV